MSNRPTGTSMDDDRLLELRPAPASTESTYAVAATPLLERLALEADDPIDWDVDGRDGDPMLVFGPREDGDRAEAAYPRRIEADDGELLAPVPDGLLSADPPRGLGVDVAREGATLLFDSVATDETVGLVPERFDDGTPYRPEPRADAPERSDPIAEETLARERSASAAPRPETLDAPIDPEVLDSVLEETAPDYEPLAAVLEAVSRRRLVGEADAVEAYPPLAIDDRGLCVVPPAVWDTEIPASLERDVDDETLEAARLVHERQARALLAGADAPDRARGYRDFHEAYDAVVTDERETAEWEVAEPGSRR